MVGNPPDGNMFFAQILFNGGVTGVKQDKGQAELLRIKVFHDPLKSEGFVEVGEDVGDVSFQLSYATTQELDDRLYQNAYDQIVGQ